jgi:DNA-binding transcriptional regulator YiaG
MDSELSLLWELYEEYYDDEERRENERLEKERQALTAKREAREAMIKEVGQGNLGREMKITRDALKMTQKQLAQVWKVTRRDISVWENNVAPVPPELILKLREMFNQILV